MTARVDLRPLGRGDGPLFRALYCDRGTMRHIGAPFSRTYAAASLRATIDAARDDSGPHFFVICERSANRPVGLCSIRRTSDDRCREVGIMLVRTARGRGLARDALYALIEAAFRTLPITAVSVQYRSANAAAARLCDNLGFPTAGRVRAGGEPKTCVRMLRRPQWRKRFNQPARGKEMSNIIGFLERAGRDAALRHATREQLLRRMNEEHIDAAMQDALLQSHAPSLGSLLGVRETMYCQNVSTEPPKKKKAPAKKKPAKKAPAKKPAKKAPSKRKR